MSERTGLHKIKCLNGAHLKLIAMVCMLLDHIWATFSGGQMWMTAVGRIAFPIFAFQVAEGYAHTKNFKKYLLRMFLFAVISEIPFNFMLGGWWINPFHQNVMFTFCIALLMMRLIDRAAGKHWALRLLVTVAVLVLGYLLGVITFVDYGGYGVLMVLVFWLFRNVKFHWLIQLAAMICINCILMKGLQHEFFLFGHRFLFPNQGFALLAMIPIGLYGGKRGVGQKWFQYAVYAFYPVHMLVLYLIAVLF